MNRFDEYFSDANIIRQLCKERVKVAKQRRERSYVLHLVDGALIQPESRRIDGLLPPRAQWSAFRPRFRDTGRDTNLSTLVFATQTLRAANPNHWWAIRLNEFINELRARALGGRAFRFACPQIFWELKNEQAYRPISKFELMDGIICSLLARYLTDFFDVAFGSSSYAFRSRSRDGQMPTRDTAINTLYELRRSVPGQNLFVAECDIRAFFDSVEHGLAARAFDKTAVAVQGTHPERVMHPRARVLFQAYLDCYTFPKVVLGDALARLKREDSQGTFPWPEQELQRLWKVLPSLLRIGIPQGGAISGVVANLVLNLADQRVEAVRQSAKGDLHYFRYCDDTLFVSTNPKSCQLGLKAYLDALAEIKLPVHKPTNMWIHRRLFWKQKSKAPYCWQGRKWFGSVPWVQFLGYQIRYDGLMRVRRDSVLKQQKRLIELVDEAKWGLLKHVQDDGVIHSSKRRVLSSVQQRLVNAGVGRVQKGSKNVLTSKCWLGGFQVLQGKPIASRFLKILDKTREQQLRRMHQANIPYGTDALRRTATYEMQAGVGFEASYFAQCGNEGGDSLITNPYRPSSVLERFAFEPIFLLCNALFRLLSKLQPHGRHPLITQRSESV